MAVVRTIALDGPAGSGKSTIGHRLADALDYIFLDTGILYRALTRALLSAKIDPHNAAAVRHFARQVHFDVYRIRPQLGFRINGKYVYRLQAQKIDETVPIVAAYPEVRAQVRKIQHQFVQQGPLIVAGRDIGTAVLPDADLKLYLDVSLNVRAQRHYASPNKPQRSLEEIKEALLLRDLADATRDISPMQVAEDAIIINTDALAVDEVLTKILQYVKPPEAPEGDWS